MVKTLNTITLASALLLMLAWTQGAVAAGTSIAVVNSGLLIKEAPQAEAARARLSQEFADRRAQLQQEQQKLMEDVKKLQRDQSVMSKSTAEKKQNELRQRQQALKQKQDDYNQQVQQREKSEFDKLRKQIYDVIVRVAKARGYDLVLSEGIVYAADKINITDEVLAELGKAK